MDKELKNELRRDELGEAVEEAKGFFTRPEVVKPALAVAALFLVLIGLYTAQRFRASAAESAFARATEVYHADVDAAAAGPSSTGEKYKTSTEKFQKAKGMFDDVLATGGTAEAAGRLVSRSHGVVAGFAFLIELDFLGGRSKLAPHAVASVVHY